MFRLMRLWANPQTRGAAIHCPEDRRLRPGTSYYYCFLSLLEHHINTMSLRRGGAAVSLQTDSDTAQIGAKPMSSPKARRNHFISGILVVFLVGGYFMTFSSDASTKNKKKTYSSLRAYPAVSTVLPNFEPIHEQCKKRFAQKLVGRMLLLTHSFLFMSQVQFGSPNRRSRALPVMEFSQPVTSIGANPSWANPMALLSQSRRTGTVMHPKRRSATIGGICGETMCEYGEKEWLDEAVDVIVNLFRSITHGIVAMYLFSHFSSWGRGVPDHARYYAGEDVVEYQIAFGALPNHHCILASLDYVYPTPPYDDTLADRFSDPGAGAFTYVCPDCS